MALAKDPTMAARLKIIRNHGMEPKYCHDVVGGNFRLDALQAAVLLKKVPYLAAWSRRRWEIAQYYQTEFSEFAPLLQSPAEPFKERIGNRGHTYNQFVVRTAKRDDLREHLRALGIGTELYYPIPLHLQKCFARMTAKSCRMSESAAREVLALPIFPELNDAEVEVVAKGVVSFFKK